MEVIAWEQWKRWSKEGDFTLLPYIRKIGAEPGALLPAFWDKAWEDASAHACLLESGKGGRYSFVGLKPVSVIEGKGGRARVLEPNAAEGGWTETRAEEGAPLKLLREWLRPWTGPRPAGVPDCIGGVLGFWSYDIVRSLEKLPVLAEDDLGLPDYVFQRFEELWIADHVENVIYCAVHAQVKDARGELLERQFDLARQRTLEMERQWTSWVSASRSVMQTERHTRMLERMERDQLQIDVESLPGLSTSMSRAAYETAVRRIQHYIGQGDVFQVNLAMRQSKSTNAKPETLYEWLRLVNPSPYMGMLRTPSFALVSASPELLVKLDEGRLSTRPIAGTRRRGRSAEEDRAMEEELLLSEKERAEHVMLVDLERNDLGRVAAYGTVKVPELMTVERYSHVMHLVSQVEAKLAAGKDALDVLAAVFPGGTITGAPKVRTMEIIEELEPTRRGPYTGSMGWIDYSGNMEFNIIIRTIAVQDGICHIQAGAGIVIDSEPEREFHESLNKAKALWKAVQYSEGQGESI
ncbi:anthranilate synthase component I family protein [Cohnella cholangitidis]|uniref:Anthranilate synthase component I family protein n=1 Tax=Cohnella cholangitidis TaxID=2598458 RepID=A0A7G5BZ89_9BACL|nr:anthranilate synthase component I family protein [Cohnella cholangitidis]QMV42273.1 anthranilate synthase component I family protein [Cohnella cholangitidis]